MIPTERAECLHTFYFTATDRDPACTRCGARVSDIALRAAPAGNELVERLNELAALLDSPRGARGPRCAEFVRDAISALSSIRLQALEEAAKVAATYGEWAEPMRNPKQFTAALAAAGEIAAAILAQEKPNA